MQPKSEPRPQVLAEGQGDANAEPRPSVSALKIPTLIQLAQAAFRRDLPKLLSAKKRLGEWVAYSGEQQLGFGKTKAMLYRECLERGLQPNQFVVRCITPEMPDEIDAEELDV